MCCAIVMKWSLDARLSVQIHSGIGRWIEQYDLYEHFKHRLAPNGTMYEEISDEKNQLKLQPGQQFLTAGTRYENADCESEFKTFKLRSPIQGAYTV